MIISFIWNHWINQQTAATVNPPSLLTSKVLDSSTETQANLSESSEDSYEFMNEMEAPDVVAKKMKKKEIAEPQHDEKIIYEMPLTNKFLLQ